MSTHPLGTAVTWQSEAWQVIGIMGDGVRKLLSLDGERFAYVRVDYLKPAP